MKTRPITTFACLMIALLFASSHVFAAGTAVKIVEGGIQFPADGSIQLKSATLPGCANGGVLVYHTDSWYCGTIMPVTNGIVTCVAGACSVSACLPGFGDCDALVETGCETPLTTVQNCGGCGVAHSCPANSACRTYACTNSSCTPTNAAAHTACPGGICDGSGNCVAGCTIGGTDYPSGALNPANSCQACNPLISTTGWSLLADGSSCNDGNACTQTDTCQAGTCVGGNPVTCAALDQCHTAGACNPSTGVCSNPAKASGSPCSQNGGIICNGTGSCVACVMAADCPVTGNQCATSVCTANSCGISYMPAETPCSQNGGIICNGTGSCVACVMAADCPVTSNQCATSVCTANSCGISYMPAETLCSQNGGIKCNGTGSCVACVMSADCPVTGNQCATSVCTANSCGISYMPAETPCSQNGGIKCDGAGSCR